MNTYDPDNIFARILRGDIPCKAVFESKNSFAFYDIAPAAPVHVLIIPRGAYTDFHDFITNASAEEITDFWQAVDCVTEELDLIKDGFRLVTNMGRNGGQEVPHFHVHILGGTHLPPLAAQTR